MTATCTVTARWIGTAPTTAVLVVSTTADLLTGPIVSGGSVVVDGCATLQMGEGEGLVADTQYYFGIKEDGVLSDQGRGAFKTLAASPTTFKMVVSGDKKTDSNDIVCDRMAEEEPDLNLFVGDAHYENPDGTTEEATFHLNWDRVQAASKYRALTSERYTMAVPDNHDYVINPQDSTNANRDTACDVYRQRIPGRYEDDAHNGLYWHQKWGRFVVILLDCRTLRDPATDTDDATKTMLGADQKDWLKAIIADVANADCVFHIVSSVEWVSGVIVGDDGWGGYSTERTELADHFFANADGRIFFWSGNSHRYAHDDGTNGDYTTGTVGATVYCTCASPLDHNAVTVGGTYSSGSFVTGGRMHQYALVECEVIGANQIDVTITGKRSTTSGLSTLHTASYSVMF